MGHNLVVTKASDMAAAGADAAGAGLANDYVKPKDERILAQTKMAAVKPAAQKSTSLAFLPRRARFFSAPFRDIQR